MKIDKIILAGFQKIAWWIQDLIGADNFHLARFFYAIGTVSLMIVLRRQANEKEWFPFVFNSVVFSLLWFGYMYPKIKQMEERTYQNLHKGFRNEAVLSFQSFRIISVMSVLLHWTERELGNMNFRFDMGVFHIAILMFAYFLSCTPKPPGISKFEEILNWVNSFLPQPIYNN